MLSRVVYGKTKAVCQGCSQPNSPQLENSGKTDKTWWDATGPWNSFLLAWLWAWDWKARWFWILGSSCSSRCCCGLGSMGLQWAPFSFSWGSILGSLALSFSTKAEMLRFGAAGKGLPVAERDEAYRAGPETCTLLPSLGSASSLSFLLLEPCPHHDVAAMELNSARSSIPFFSNHGTKARVLFRTAVRHKTTGCSAIAVGSCRCCCQYWWHTFFKK